jgi:hypothetical protein
MHVIVACLMNAGSEALSKKLAFPSFCFVIVQRMAVRVGGPKTVNLSMSCE